MLISEEVFMINKQFLSTSELAKLLGISRIAVFHRIKNGSIKATKVGRNYIIDRNDVGIILNKSLNAKDKQEIDKTIKKTLSEYGETLRLLGAE